MIVLKLVLCVCCVVCVNLLVIVDICLCVIVCFRKWLFIMLILLKLFDVFNGCFVDSDGRNVK